MHKKIAKKSLVFEIRVSEFSLLRREHMSSAVNELTNTLKILYSTKTDFYQMNYAHIN